MTRHKKFLAFALLSGALIQSLATPSLAQSTDLLTLYHKAENYDSGIFAAESAYLADKQSETIALAALLPNVNAQVSWSQNNGESSFDPSGRDSTKTRTEAVTLSQPLISVSDWHSLSASEQSSLQAKANYLAAKQELILNVANAYFTVLREQENLRSDRSQEAAVQRQYEQAREQFDVGLIAITDVHEAKASYDASQTARIRSEGNLTIAEENLARITGQFTTKLHGLKADFPIKMDATSAEEWVEAALSNNLSIQAAQFNVNALEQRLKSQKAGHYPTLNLEASYGHDHVTNLFGGNNNNEGSSVAVVVNVPLYSGGITHASTKQARYRLEQAKHQLQSAQRQAKIETRTEYINLKTNIQTVESLKQNIVSRESALEATKEGYKVGTRNIVEVLDAERNYFTALRDYANARFDFVESSLRIKQAAGTLSVKDIKRLNTWLASQ